MPGSFWSPIPKTWEDVSACASGGRAARRARQASPASRTARVRRRAGSVGGHRAGLPGPPRRAAARRARAHVLPGLRDRDQNDPGMFSDPCSRRSSRRRRATSPTWTPRSGRAGPVISSTGVRGRIGREPEDADRAAAVQATRLPTDMTYVRDFQAFLKRYPKVREYAAFNEANHITQPTYHRPRRTRTSRHLARVTCPACTIVGLTLVAGFENDIATHALPGGPPARRPSPAGLGAEHLRRHQPQPDDTDHALVKAFPPGPSGSPRPRRGRSSPSRLPFDLSRQARTTANVFTQAVALRKRVARVYWYEWRGGGNNDERWDWAAQPRRRRAPPLRRAEAALQDALDTFRPCRPGAPPSRPCGRLRHPLGSAGRRRTAAMTRSAGAPPRSPAAPPRRGPPARGAAGISLGRPAPRRGQPRRAGLLGRAAGPACNARVGWTGDVVTAARVDAGEQAVGGVRRIPLEGLPSACQQESAQKFVVDDPRRGRALRDVVDVRSSACPPSRPGPRDRPRPRRIDAGQPIEVLVFLHGFTESTGRPFAGWRALVRPASDVPSGGQALRREQQLERLRQASTAPTPPRCATSRSDQGRAAARRERAAQT